MHHSVSSSFSSRPTASGANGKVLPLIYCPDCNIEILRLVSKSVANLDKVFYKCPNYKQTTCRFFKWEDDYKKLLKDMGLVEQEPTDVQPNEVHVGGEYEARFDELIKTLKKNEEGRVHGELEKIKCLVFTNCIVTMNVLLILIVIFLMHLYK